VKLSAADLYLETKSLSMRNALPLKAGYSMDAFLRDLARRVFFWPGGLDRPIRPGQRAVAAYADSDVIIRVPFLEIVESHIPYFSRCNSGATRMQPSGPVPRGPSTYREAMQCDFRPSGVIEVTFLNSVLLPHSAQVARSLTGRWESLQFGRHPEVNYRH
jgi:hypothetical protein